MKKQLIRLILIFVALATAGIGISAGVGSRLAGVEQLLVVSVGSTVFGAGLVIFLIEMLRWERENRS